MNPALDSFSVFVVALIAVCAFTISFARTRVIALGRHTLAISVQGISTMLDPELPDSRKEKAVRAAGGALLLAGFSMAWRVGLACTVAIGIIFAAQFLAIANSTDVFTLLMRVDFIIGLSVVAISIAMVMRMLHAQTPAGVETVSDTYTNVDQLVHILAFSSPWVSRVLATLDDWIARDRLARLRSTRTIFITSLARGGTTALLNAMHALPQLATYEYRDMPFIPAPMIWSKISGNRVVQRRERAHGDGLQIDLNSPEAFDEVLWRLYWPGKYGNDQIELWSEADIDPEKLARLQRNFNKMISLRVSRDRLNGRLGYVSKNNTNIARLDFLDRGFPDAAIVVPIRRPAAHAASLHRQHMNFAKRHADDAFTKRYMRDIGHLEFGALHRPIAFPGQDENPYGLTDLNYWLFYWVTAFQEISKHQEKCTFITQDTLRAKPQETIQALAAHLDLDIRGLDFRGFFRRRADNCEIPGFDPELLADARAIYIELAKKAIEPEHAETR